MAHLTVMVFVFGWALTVADEGEIAGQLEAEVTEQCDVAQFGQATMASGWLQRDDIISEVGLERLAIIREDISGEVAKDDRLMVGFERLLEMEVECRAFFAPAR